MFVSLDSSSDGDIFLDLLSCHDGLSDLLAGANDDLTRFVPVAAAHVGDDNVHPACLSANVFLKILVTKHAWLFLCLIFTGQDSARDVSGVLWPKEEGRREAFNADVEDAVPGRLHRLVSDALEGLPEVDNKLVVLGPD